MWASHFVRNGNKLSISSWLATEVQVCRNVGRPNFRLPNLVNIIVYLNNLQGDRKKFLEIWHELTVSILVASGGVACSSEASESPSVHPLATKVVRKPMFFRRSFLSGPPRAKNPPVKKDGYWEGRNRVSKYNTTY